MNYEIMMGAVFTNDYKEYPSKLNEINQKGYKGKVTEVYGSLRSKYLKLNSARPDFRVPDVNLDYFENYIKELNKYDIKFNYAMNASHYGDLEEIDKNFLEIVEDLRWLESIGVYRVIVSNPLIMDIVSTHTNLHIEVSTILNVNSISAVVELKERYPNINKICMGIDNNRNIEFVRNMQRECADIGIELEILVSEFCTIGKTSCSQVHRQTCYAMHSYNMSEDIARKGINSNQSKQNKLIKGYPWTSGKNGCVFSRSIEPDAWLSTRTVWPNEIEQYVNATNVKKIKVTGRTATPEWALWVAETYAKGKYDGPLAGLWLALPAGVLSNHLEFKKHQSVGEKAAPYLCSDLSTKFEILTKIPYKNLIVAKKMAFMDIFFEHPDIDWNQVKWVDKPNEDLRDYESNWLHEWDRLHKMLH